jgi:TolB protein
MKSELSRATRVLFILLFCLAIPARSQELLITKAAGSKTSLDLSRFSGAGPAAGVFGQTLDADLRRCGWFTFARPAAYTVSGSYGGAAAFTAQCQVMNVVKGEAALNKTYSDTPANARRLAHKVADDIILAVKGFRGICSGRIVMVGNRTGNKELYLCDADGGNLRQLTNDRSISLSPHWSPSGAQILYTSYRKGYADAYLIDLASGARSCFANCPGINMAGDISPNGREALLVLSRDGNPEVYVKSLSGNSATRLTRTPRAGEASPTWSPDGTRIAYVSDAAGAGSPQLYIMDRSGTGRRLTSRGRENVAPDWGPNGWIAYCSKRSGLYGIYIINPATMEDQPVSPADTHYEDPAWASDGRHLVCTRREGRGSRIYLLDTMGDPPVCLTPDGGSWFSPAWCAQ